MALRSLTAEEKQSLVPYQPFIDACYWATRDYGAFWSINDGSGSATEAARIKWAKDRINGVAITLNDIGDQQLALKYTKFLDTGVTVDLPAAPADPAVILAALKTAGTFQTLASKYYDQLGESINMSANGNN